MKVLTIGTFDILHYGHIDFLNRCRELGDVRVGVNTDEFVKTFKAAPIMSLAERRHALESVGFLTIPNKSAGRELIEDFTPDVLAVGSDWARQDYFQQIDVTQDWLDKKGIIMAYIPYVQWNAISSSEIKRRVKDAERSNTALAAETRT